MPTIDCSRSSTICSGLQKITIPYKSPTQPPLYSCKTDGVASSITRPQPYRKSLDSLQDTHSPAVHRIVQLCVEDIECYRYGEVLRECEKCGTIKKCHAQN